MPSKSPLKIVFGTGNVGDKSVDTMARFDTPAEVTAILDAFAQRGYTEIDSARYYSPHAPGTCEPRLGAAGAGERFAVSTKVASREPGNHSKAQIAKSIDDSLAALKLKQVDIEYLHQPERTTPFEETCEAMDKAYREGKFKRFGLSNYPASEVEEILQICEARGFVKPTVYEGQYNPIVRGAEKELFPLLRKHSIAFYAWSPAGAGFFAGNYKHVQPGGRFDPSHNLGKFYGALYLKPAIEAATDRVINLAAEHGIGGHAAALRWTVYHSKLAADFGDAVIIGASSPVQLNSNMDMVEAGPLPQAVVDAFEQLHKEVGDDAIPYHW
ncbi:Aflatoxin B1 aldehyde reductase member 2 [Pleurostoma richardsiae]|uniref:Aflatoxin B1 aldehyde reductase member 2 n=1 Tax=Pleurostoma richardsiae TaxID=41990 RepID=A0AA38RAI9_9PEZI|nr:Aflatoxin B1 aldehyde reductase member 2 [Pleurostoma richardsiae]